MWDINTGSLNQTYNNRENPTNYGLINSKCATLGTEGALFSATSTHIVIGDKIAGVIGFVDTGIANEANHPVICAPKNKHKGLLFYCPSSGAINCQAYEMYPKVIGFATETKLSGQTQKIKYSGILKGFSGLIPGAEYYLQTDGTIDAEDGLVKVGKALSTTELLIDIKDPW